MNSMRPWSGWCQRCGHEGSAYTMSVFSLLLVCPTCKDAERRHPRHAEAAAAELASVRSGDLNFAGLGEIGPCGWRLADGRIACGRCRPDGTDSTPVWPAPMKCDVCQSNVCS